MPSKQQCRNACITINKTHTLPQNIDTTHIKYYIFGRERAPNTGTLHLQGYVEFSRAMTYAAIKKALRDNTIHIEQRRGSQDQAIAYCRKEDQQPFEYGEPKGNGRPKGRKTQQVHEELQEVKELIDSGATPDELMAKEAGFYYRYKSYIMDYYTHHKHTRECAELMNWASTLQLNIKQREMLQALTQQTDRKVSWIYDPKGNTGKSVFSRYMIAKYRAIRFTNAKTADIALAYNGEEVVIFDFARCINGNVNYGAIEHLKNGMIFSSKYRSKSRIFEKSPKIIILANFPPDTTQLSEDRWDIHDWSEEYTN